MFPNDDASVGGGAQQEIGGWVPVEAADEVEVLLQDRGFGPLADVWSRGSLKNPDFIIGGADGCKGAVVVPGEALDPREYPVLTLAFLVHI